MLKFKEEFRDHNTEILVDNARTHTAKVYDLNLFNKTPGTRCEYKTIDWMENGQPKRFFYFFLLKNDFETLSFFYKCQMPRQKRQIQRS